VTEDEKGIIQACIKDINHSIAALINFQPLKYSHASKEAVNAITLAVMRLEKLISVSKTEVNKYIDTGPYAKDDPRSNRGY
jgi:hypothetical protein